MLSDSIFTTVTTTVNAIGTIVIEEKRFIALKSIVTSTDPVIQKLVELINTDLDKFQLEVESNARSVYADEVTALRDEYQKLTFRERVVRLNELDGNYDIRTAAPKFVDQLAKATLQMGKTHAAVSTALAKDKYSTIESIKQIGKLQEEVARLREFHETLGAEEGQ